MSDSSREYGARPPLSADDALPPVEPPSAGFILQLFVVPAIIVVIIVMVWLVFNWVARTGSDPQDYVRALRRDNAGRWQAAVNLANALRGDDATARELRKDQDLVQELADMLAAEIKTGSLKEEPLTLRIFLCQALGEFDVPGGMGVLITAATTQRDEKEVEVRLAALRALALLCDNLKRAGQPGLTDSHLLEIELLNASHDEDPRVRSAAAYAMGVIGSEAYVKPLVGLLADSYPDVRYNAANWLAQQGNAEAIPVLAEMLDPDDEAGVEIEEVDKSRPFKRAMIVTNGLRATRALAKQNPSADVAPLTANIEKLLAAPLEAPLKVQAAEALRELKQR